MKTSNVSLFIADISGYTKFIVSSDLIHAKEIINEILINLHNKALKGMVLNQVEGDALFYYSKKVSKEQLKELSNTLHNEFHKTIEKLTRGHKTCPHGICKHLRELHLKFIIHEGEVIFQDIGNSEQLIGTSVIEIHRLLKNSVNKNSYAIIVNKDGLHSDEYKYLGKLNYDIVDYEH